MSLADDPTQQNKPTQQPPKTPPSQPPQKQLPPKLKKAVEIATKYIDKSYSAALPLIMEETPCNKSTAHKAYHIVHDKKTTKEDTNKEQTPSLTIVTEKDAQLPFTEDEKPPTEQPEPLTPIEEKPAIMISDEQQKQIDLFQDMFRGMYSMFFSKDGVLGEKYGRTKKQCEDLADMQFRWLIRRYSIEQLERFDTILLVGAYGTLIGGIAKDYMAERKRKKAEKRAD
jgi:hypothetical protein